MPIEGSNNPNACGTCGGGNSTTPGTDYDQNNVGRVLSAGLVERPATGQYNIDSLLAAKLNLQAISISEIETPVIVQMLLYNGTLIEGKYIYMFKPGRGEYGVGGIEIEWFDLIYLSVDRFTINDVANDPNAVVISLGELPDNYFIPEANSEERDFTDTTKQYFLIYSVAGVGYLAHFIGEPGYYGGSYANQFTLSLFEDLTPIDEPTETLQLGNTETTAGRGDHTEAAYTHSQITAGNPHGTAIADIAGLETSLSTKADLVGGVIPSSQLPGYVDDVLEYPNIGAFPSAGESGKLYIAVNTNLVYRWGGSTYVVTSSSLALGITSTTAGRGDWNKTAYDHSQLLTGNPHGTAITDIPGLSTAINAKLTGTAAVDADLQVLIAPGTSSKFVDNLRLFNFWAWIKSTAQNFTNDLKRGGLDVITTGADATTPVKFISAVAAVPGATIANTLYLVETGETEGSVNVAASGTNLITIAHTLGVVPAYLKVDAKNAAAGNILYRSADASNIYISYTGIPTGTLEYWIGYKK